MFNSNNKLICIDDKAGYAEIVCGKIYTFSHYLDKKEFIVLQEFHWPVLAYRFIKVTKNTARFYGKVL